jgi:spermidine/putrescine ABC transporter ATP-binding subunit
VGEAFDLELVAVSKHYGAFAAVREVSLGVRRGEFLALLGPSGCGKTTTIRMIAGLLQPDGGHILIRSQDVVDVPTHRRNLGMFFQNYALFPHRTVRDNIAFGLVMRKRPHDEIASRVTRMLGLVQLEGLGDRYPRQLSGGQQQRVALARALAIEPDLLLLDEPLSNLDPKLRQHMRLELKDLQRQLGITTILVTHDQEEALIMSDRIGVMYGGRIEQVGTPHEVYHDPVNRFVAGFLGESNFFAARVEGMRGDGRAAVTLASGETIEARVRGPLRPGQHVTLAVRPERVQMITGERPPGSSLRGTLHEQVFGGSLTRYHVRLSGDALCVVEQHARAAVSLTPGAVVTIAWAPEDGLILSDEQQSGPDGGPR